MCNMSLKHNRFKINKYLDYLQIVSNLLKDKSGKQKLIRKKQALNQFTKPQ